MKKHIVTWEGTIVASHRNFNAGSSGFKVMNKACTFVEHVGGQVRNILSNSLERGRFSHHLCEESTSFTKSCSQIARG